MQYIKVLLLITFLSVASLVRAQVNPALEGGKIDSALINPKAKRDSSFYPKRDSVVNVHSAKKVEEKPVVFKDSARLALERQSKLAVRRSMIIPGWGQLTNKRWWKVPIIWGGFVGMGLVIDFNQREYKKLLTELRHNYAYTHGDTANNTPWIDPIYGNYNYDRIVDAKDFYRRNRDLAFLVTGALYAVNIIDAYVDATFFRYDVSENLSIKVLPSFQPNFAYSSYQKPLPGFSIRFNLR